MATEQRANCFLGTWAKIDPVAKMVVHPDPGGRFQRQNNECPFCIVKRAGKSLQRTLDKNGQKSLPNWLILWIHWNYIDVSKITSFSENSIILGGAQGQLTHIMNNWGGAQGQLTLTMQSDETMWIAWISSSPPSYIDDCNA